MNIVLDHEKSSYKTKVSAEYLKYLTSFCIATEYSETCFMVKGRILCEIQFYIIWEYYSFCIHCINIYFADQQEKTRNNENSTRNCTTLSLFPLAIFIHALWFLINMFTHHQNIPLCGFICFTLTFLEASYLKSMVMLIYCQWTLKHSSKIFFTGRPRW